jgi:hypothetical protein
VGGPEKDEQGERGLHGLISNTPAEVISIIQPDPARGLFEMSITGVIKETKIFGPSLEQKRTISSTLGKSSIHSTDEIINRGNTQHPICCYHAMGGLADEGTALEGQYVPERCHGDLVAEGDEDLKVVHLSGSSQWHGEELIMIDTAADENGKAVGYTILAGIAVVMKYQNQLPWMSNWRHWSKGNM